MRSRSRTVTVSGLNSQNTPFGSDGHLLFKTGARMGPPYIDWNAGVNLCPFDLWPATPEAAGAMAKVSCPAAPAARTVPDGLLEHPRRQRTRALRSAQASRDSTGVGWMRRRMVNGPLD